MNQAYGETELYQENYLERDGLYFYVGANMKFTDTKLTVEITNKHTNENLSIESETYDDCYNNWQVLTNTPFPVYVVACHRQDSDEEWPLAGSDWSIIYWAEQEGSWISSSYFNMDTSTMENGLWTDDGNERLSTGIWNWESSAF